MKVSTKLYFGAVFQFLVAISLVAVFLYMLQKQEHDSVVINLAGRQRMLSQKMTKEILLFSQGVFPAEKVLNTIEMFDQTLKALTYGGKAPLDLVQRAFTTLPTPETRVVVTQLKSVESRWSSFSQIAKKYLNRDVHRALRRFAWVVARDQAHRTLSPAQPRRVRSGTATRAPSLP